MDLAKNNTPRVITDSFDAVCKTCRLPCYVEKIIGELQADGSYSYRREVRGGYTQSCDSEGTPTGPVIPKCNCEV